MACVDNVDWARRAWEDLWDHSPEELYVNFPGLGEDGESGADLAQAAYGANHDRLVELKRSYDPENLFGSHGGVELVE